MKKLLLVATVLAVLAMMWVVPTYGSTVCSHPIYPRVDATKVGHWVTLHFSIDTESLQVDKPYTRFVYLRVNKDDLARVGLRYHEDMPRKMAPWVYILYMPDSKGHLYLESRKLWLKNGIYHMNMTYYVCGIHNVKALLKVSKGGVEVIPNTEK